MKPHFALATLLIAVMLPVAALACSQNETIEAPGFGIYLVDTGELIISDKDITSYNSSNYEIELNEEGTNRWYSLYSGGFFDCSEFAVKVNGEEIYRGNFTSLASSTNEYGITIFLPIKTIGIMVYKNETTIQIDYDCLDPRNDWRLLTCFETGAKSSIFGIYLVETGELMISDQDIKSYNASDHKIELNEEGIKRWDSFFPGIWSLDGKQFAVKIDGQEIYLGRFQSPVSSYYYCDEIIISYLPGYTNKIPIYDDGRITNFFETEPKECTFGLYLVETGDLIISNQHIQSYNTSTHEIALNDEGIEKWNSFIASHDPADSTISGIWLHDKHFVVQINGKEVYSGSFLSMASSFIPFGEATISYYPWLLDDEFNTIGISYNCFDPRYDPRIINFFAAEGLLE